MGTASVQGELWGAAAADWAELQEPMGKLLWMAMLEAAEVKQGAKFLDAGCGSGGASHLADMCGAKVTGLDASQAMIEIAKQRISSGDFHVGDLEELPFDDEIFDISFAANSLMFTTEPLNAIKELKRVTVPDGRVVIGVWGLPEQCEMRDVFKAVIDVLPCMREPTISPLHGNLGYALKAAVRRDELAKVSVTSMRL